MIRTRHGPAVSPVRGERHRQDAAGRAVHMAERDRVRRVGSRQSDGGGAARKDQGLGWKVPAVDRGCRAAHSSFAKAGPAVLVGQPPIAL